MGIKRYLMILFIFASVFTLNSQEQINKGETAKYSGIIMTEEKYRYYVEKEATNKITNELNEILNLEIKKINLMNSLLTDATGVLKEEVALYKNLNLLYKEYQKDNKKLQRNNRILITGINISTSFCVISVAFGVAGVMLFYYSINTR